jgi:hypothetical protein
MQGQNSGNRGNGRNRNKRPIIGIPERGDGWKLEPIPDPPSNPDPEPNPGTSNPIVSGSNPYQVKPATKDIVLFDDESTPIEVMADLIFEDIGGNELINISRFDIINGQSIDYQPIKNLSYIKQRYGPNNLFALQNTSDKLFGNFPIKLDKKLDPSSVLNNIYRDSATGSIILEFINVSADEEIEVQIASSGIIYGVDNL